MDIEKNTRLIQEAYAAFGRGDIPAVLDAFADDIVWMPITGAGSHVPMAGTRYGKAAVAEFFRILGESLTFEWFEPKRFVAQDDMVVVLGHYLATTRANITFESDWVMLFTIKDGRVVKFQEFTDSALINAAFESAAI